METRDRCRPLSGATIRGDLPAPNIFAEPKNIQHMSQLGAKTLCSAFVYIWRMLSVTGLLICCFTLKGDAKICGLFVESC